MDASLPVEVLDNLHELLHLFRIRMRAAIEARHPELTFGEMRVLMRAGHRPGITQKDLVEHSRTDKAQMARILANLQDKGWLERSTSEEDKRVRCLHLTAQGRRLFTKLRALQEQVAGQTLQGCPPPAQEQLLALLRQARDSASRA